VSKVNPQHLWDDFSDEEKSSLLERLSVKPKKPSEVKKAVDPFLLATRRRNFFKASPNHEELQREAFGEGGVDILDGWARIFVVTRQGRLLIYRGVRFEEEWLAPVSDDLKTIKAASIWPRGMLPKANPWKMPWFVEVAVLKPEWQEDIKQAKVTFPSNPPTTWYISPEVLRYPSITGYLVPRKQARSRPWKKEDGVIRFEEKKSFVPDFNKEDYEILLKHGSAGKAYVIRRHRRLLWEDIKAKRVNIFQIKEAVETLLKSLKK